MDNWQQLEDEYLSREEDNSDEDRFWRENEGQEDDDDFKVS